MSKKYIYAIGVLFFIILSILGAFTIRQWLKNKPNKPYFADDIYNTYPLGSSIDSIFNQLPKRNLFIITDNYIVTLVDLYEKRGVDTEANHLLFYEKEFILNLPSSPS